MKLLSIILILSSTLHAKTGCNINTYADIVFLQKDQTCKKIIKSTNCHQKITKEFLRKLVEYNGNVPTRVLSNHLKDRFRLAIAPVINHKLIRVRKIDEIVRESIQLKENLRFGDIEYVGNSCFKGSTDQIDIKVSCKLCDAPGNSNLQMETAVNSGEGTIINWLNAKIKSRIKVFKAVKNLNAYMSKLRKDHFEEVFIDTDNPKKYLRNIDDIPYYRLNRAIQQGDTLKINSLSPVKLVHTGRKTKVILKMKNMSIESSGIARQSGILGETIELLNEKNKKKIIGKIVDYNKVQVDL